MNRESTLNSTLTLWNLRAYYLVSNKYNQFVILEQFYVLSILLKDLNPRVVPSAPTELMWKSDQWRLLRPVKTDQSEQTALKETVAKTERLRRRGKSSAAWDTIRELKNNLIICLLSFHSMRTVIAFLFALKHVDMKKCKLKNDHNYWTFKGEIYKNCW